LNDGSGRWKAHGPTPETVLPRVPLNHAANIHVADPSAGQESIVHTEELDIGRFDSDYYALQLGNAILGGNSAANRLYHDLRQITGLVHDVLAELREPRPSNHIAGMKPSSQNHQLQGLV
jgi:zinc protease